MAVTFDAAAPRAASQPPSQATIEQLQDQRQELVEQYVGARPEGSNGWKQGVGIGAGVVGAGIGLGAILLANRGKGPMYQGFNLMLSPFAMGAGGAVGYFGGGRLAEIATRPSGDAAATQVAATRDELRQQIADVDRQLTAADGRRPQPLPAIDDSSQVSIGRIAGHTGAGLGIGLLSTAGVLAGAEALTGGRVQGGPTALAAFAAPAVAAGAISYLNQRDEANGGQGSMLRSAGIGAAALGATALVPAFQGIPVAARLLGGAALGAAIGTAIHAVSVSSRD